MRFITEDDLREIYRDRPFVSYEIDDEASLTPAARQFLVDRGIDIYSNDPALTSEPVPLFGGDEWDSAPREANVSADDRRAMKFAYRVKDVENEFLRSIRMLMDEDVYVAQELTKLMKHLSGIRNPAGGTLTMSEPECEGCSGINDSNFSCCIGDCFEINEFHLQLPDAGVILQLQHLRNQLNLLALDLPDLTDGDCDDMTARLMRIINTVSILICKAFGSKTCQRQQGQ